LNCCSGFGRELNAYTLPIVRILHLSIGSWRNLRDVDLEIPEGASLVCLVGENGTGKSTVLELLSAAAQHLGITQGGGANRGNPFAEATDLVLRVRVPIGDLATTMQLVESLGDSWSGEIELVYTVGQSLTTRAIGITHTQNAAAIADSAIAELRRVSETRHLFLDSDRAYPPTGFNPQLYQEIFNQDFSDASFNRQMSGRPSKTLYEEWIKYQVGVDERAAAQLVAEFRSARASGGSNPEFIDPFDGYRILLNRILPHLRFVGVEASGANRTVLFNSSGVDMTFAQLSGGEREIAFLTGQIDRFKLQRGLLLVDEPELHLHPDLLRTWLAFLRDTISDGQVWFATHSLEAVEVAGPRATFVFERDGNSRLVHNPRQLFGRPVLSALSAAIGSPAFSIAKLRFVFVEGDRQTRERERFYAVCGEPETNRFLEGGGCEEVLRRLEHISELALATDEQLRVGGVIDRDFRSNVDVAKLQTDYGVHVLGCHEIENVFLHPASIEVLLSRGGVDSSTAVTLVRAESDKYAGLWILDRALSLHSGSVTKEAKTPLAGLSLDQVTAQWSSLKARSIAEVENPERSEWEGHLESARSEYESQRGNPDWWRQCLGKQTLSGIARAMGLSSSQSVEQHVVTLWDDVVPPPTDVTALREYVARLTIVT